MLTKDQALEAVRKHGTANAAARALGVPKNTFRNWLKGAALKPRKNSGKSLADFRVTHDRSFIVPERIKDALKALGDGWEYEMQFTKLAAVSSSELSSYRDQFSDYVVVLRRDGKRAWAGSPATAQKMREMIGTL